jgi:hypothetical protein
MRTARSFLKYILDYDTLMKFGLRCLQRRLYVLGGFVRAELYVQLYVHYVGNCVFEYSEPLKSPWTL